MRKSTINRCALAHPGSFFYTLSLVKQLGRVWRQRIPPDWFRDRKIDSIPKIPPPTDFLSITFHAAHLIHINLHHSGSD